MKRYDGVIACEGCFKTSKTSFIVKNKKMQCKECYLKEEVKIANGGFGIVNNFKKIGMCKIKKDLKYGNMYDPFTYITISKGEIHGLYIENQSHYVFVKGRRRFVSEGDYELILEDKVKGVSPDAPVITNEKGAKQSDSPYRLDLVDPKALLAIGAVLKEGATKYGEDNWRGIDLNDHINHALVHIYAYLAGDNSDDHIEHATTRMIFALNKKLEL